MTHSQVHLLQPAAMVKPAAMVEGDPTSSNEDPKFMPPSPRVSLIPKLNMEPLEEHGCWLASSGLPSKPEVLNQESWERPCPNEYSFRKMRPAPLQQELLRREISPGKENSAGTECSSLHALLQQVELQHLREISLVQAKLESQLKMRAELKSYLEDFGQKFQEPECKELLQPFLQELLQIAHTDKGDQLNVKTPIVSIRSEADVVEISPWLRDESEPKTPGTQQPHSPAFRPQKTGASTATSQSGTWAFDDIKARLSQRDASMASRLSELMERSIERGTTEGPDPIEWAPRRHARELVECAAFDTFCSAAILLSAMLVGISTDLAARNCNPDTLPDFLLYADYTFTTWFLLELCLRIFAADGFLRFFLGQDWNWNVFDFCVVMLDVAGTIYTAFQASQNSAGPMQNLSMTRVARMLKITRSLRAIRLFRFLRELRKMVISVMHSGLSLLNSLVLLCIVIFMFSVYLTQNVTFYLYANKDQSSSHIEVLHEYFGSLVYAGYILFQCITTGIGWGEVARALMEVHWSNSLVLSFFMFFTVFAVLNMITGVFVDSALTSAQNERDERINSVMEKEGELVSQLQEFFGEADKDKSGAISLDELKEQIKKPMVRARLRSLEIDLTDVKRVFALLDTDKTGEVGIHEFIFGCLKMKGSAKSIDLITMMHEMRRMKVWMKTEFKDVHDRFKQQHKIQTELLRTTSSHIKMEQSARTKGGWKSNTLSPHRLDSSASMMTKCMQPSPNTAAPKTTQNEIEHCEDSIGSFDPDNQHWSLSM